jgi:hypothetical protein
MFFEYAIEPNVLMRWASNERDYYEFLREYGLGTPRIISTFPKKNARRMRSYLLSLGPTDSSKSETWRYTDMVTAIVDCLVQRDIREQNISEWNKLAKLEHARVPFNAVISESIDEKPYFLSPSAIYEPTSIWNHAKQVSFLRTSDNLIGIIFNLFQLSSKQIVIIDPYGWTKKSIEIIQKLLELDSQKTPNKQIQNLTVFYKEKIDYKNAWNASPSAQEVMNLITADLPIKCESISINIYELKENDGSDTFHNRCILSELGGISLGHGIGVSEDESHSDDATVLEKPIYLKKWAQFIMNNDFSVITSASYPKE